MLCFYVAKRLVWPYDTRSYGGERPFFLVISSMPNCSAVEGTKRKQYPSLVGYGLGKELRTQPYKTIDCYRNLEA